MVQQHNFISVDYIINDIKSHELMKNINPEVIIEAALTVIELVGIPLLTVEDFCVKELHGGKAKLPQTSLGLKSAYYTGNDCSDIEPELRNFRGYEVYLKQYNFSRMLANTDDLANIHVDKMRGNNYPSYTINNNLINVNKKSGNVLLVYNKLATDSKGIPIIPDNKSLILAITAYVKKNYFTVLSDLGKLPNERSLERAAQDYHWYVGQTQSGLAGFKSEAEVEAFLNYFRKLYQEDTNFYNRFENDNLMQRRKPL